MDLRTVNIKQPVKVYDCHLRFPSEKGADQYRRRSHLLERVTKQKDHTASSIYRLEGETMFKAGEVIETDFVFPKAMRDKAEYADSAAAESADAA